MPSDLAVVDRMLQGDRLALARLITLVENRSTLVPEIMRQIYPRTGRAYRVGLTGPPGAGKSSLADKLTALMRAAGASVGIVAVDPSSPYSGGAVLGDRIRMQAHALDTEVFIRSMATRGSAGGLARATGEVVKLLDAFGKAWILIETVGVGQTELEIARTADTTVVVLTPESGDAVQTMKAGLLEVADCFVVNKADRPGADLLVNELTTMVHLQEEGAKPSDGVVWEVPVVPSRAQEGEGVAALFKAIRRHRAVLEESGALERRRAARRRLEFQEVVAEEVRALILQRLEGDSRLARIVDGVAQGRLDPYSAVADLLASVSWLPSPPPSTSAPPA
jgi:LAO/AO transport system kinase